MSRKVDIYRSGEEPTRAVQGDLRYNTTTNSWTQYNGASWANVTVPGLSVTGGFASTNSASVVFEIPGVAGVPTGVPGPRTTGAVQIVYDTTNRKFDVYSGGSWFTSASLSLT